MILSHKDRACMDGPPLLAVSFVTQRPFSQPLSTKRRSALGGTPQVPFLAARFSAPARFRMVFEGAVSATGSEAGKVSSRASSSISSSDGDRFGVGFPIASSLRFATDFMVFSRVTRVSGINALPVGHVALMGDWPLLSLRLGGAPASVGLREDETAKCAVSET